MTSRKTAVFGIYPSRVHVERAIDDLRLAGFSENDISVLFSSPSETKEFGHVNSTKAPEGAATGTVTGATVGGIIGWLAGIGSLAIPGVGPFIAAGPIMAGLAGASLGGAVGGLTGALVGLGIPEYEAKRYEGRITDGGILLSVHTDLSEQAKRAEEILENTGAEDISSKTEGDSSNVKRNRTANASADIR